MISLNEKKKASLFPTIVVYVMDTPRNMNPVTFMSNMLYACSIMYKTKLPFVIAMNKVITTIFKNYFNVFYTIRTTVYVF